MSTPVKNEPVAPLPPAPVAAKPAPTKPVAPTPTAPRPETPKSADVGRDRLRAFADAQPTRVGTDRADHFSGTQGRDVMFGRGGADTLRGAGGDDLLAGGHGDDQLVGGDGDDVLSGGRGSDILSGGCGRDFLTGGAGDDRLDGSHGDDVLVGGRGNDRLHGGTGNDVIAAGCGDDDVDAGAGCDVIRTGAGKDTVKAGAGDDVILVDGRGSKKIDAGTGRDVVVIRGREADYTKTTTKTGVEYLGKQGTAVAGDKIVICGAEKIRFEPAPEDCGPGGNEPPQPHRPLKVEQGRVWGDPHFIGADGETFDVQGVAGKTYNVLSDKGLQVNATFGAGGMAGTTVVKALGFSIGANQVEVGVGGKLVIDGQTKGDGTYLGGAIVKKGGEITVVEEEYRFAVKSQGGHIDFDIRSDDAVKDRVLPHGLWGQTVDHDTDKRNGDKGAGAQGGGAIDGANGRTAAGDKTSVALYEVGGLFDTGFAAFNRFRG